MGGEKESRRKGGKEYGKVGRNEGRKKELKNEERGVKCRKERSKLARREERYRKK